MQSPEDSLPPQESYPRRTASFAESVIDFPRLINLLRAKAWIIATIACVIFVAALAYVLRAPEIYESRAVLIVSQETQKVVSIADIAEDKPEASDYLNTIVQAFTSRKLMLRVIKATGLEKDPSFAPPKKDGSPYTEIELASLMAEKVNVSLRRGTRLVDVSTFDENPEMAQKLAATFVKEFLREAFEQRRALARLAHEFLQEEAEQLKGKLEKAERELQAYKEKNNAVSLEERENIIVAQMRDLNEKATEAKSTRLRLEADLEQIKRINPRNADQLLRIESVSKIPQVVLIRERLLKAENDLAAIRKRYLPMHPRYFTAETRIANLNATLGESLSKAGDMVAREYEAARESEAKLDRSLQEQEERAMELNRIAIPYNVLERDVVSDRVLFESVTLRLKETYITEGIDNAPFRLAEEPLVASKPSKPRKKLILGLALVLGLTLGIVTVVAVDGLDGSLRTVDEAEGYLELPALASIPDRRYHKASHRFLKLAPSSQEDRKMKQRRETKEKSYPSILAADPASPEGEGFRTLRASISLLGRESEYRSFLFTSAIPAEGKTFVSLNFASFLAQQGLKTVIIDADLREPKLKQSLLSEAGDVPGLTDLLTAQIDLSEAVRPTAYENLSLITAGRRAPDPAQLLSNREFGGIVEQLLSCFDRVVIDSPPVNAVSDVLLIAASAHATCMVIRAGKTPKRAILRATYQLRAAHARLAGFIFNRLPIGGRSAGYYYYYYGERYAKQEVRSTPEAYASNEVSKR
ncbi:MAG TPA: polysaccharide biosynthesis tyrosine autokinase [Terrimicrobiaceae bacterium]